MEISRRNIKKNKVEIDELLDWRRGEGIIWCGSR
jgi:hypothetical protein